MRKLSCFIRRMEIRPLAVGQMVAGRCRPLWWQVLDFSATNRSKKESRTKNEKKIHFLRRRKTTRDDQRPLSPKRKKGQRFDKYRRRSTSLSNGKRHFYEYWSTLWPPPLFKSTTVADENRKWLWRVQIRETARDKTCHSGHVRWCSRMENADDGKR